jgi:hypothetical protein
MICLNNNMAALSCKTVGTWFSELDRFESLLVFV